MLLYKKTLFLNLKTVKKMEVGLFTFCSMIASIVQAFSKMGPVVLRDSMTDVYTISPF